MVKKLRGFSLIELMIVVVIVGILAAVAVPSYMNSVQKTRRADAKEALVSAAAAMERYFFTHNSYTETLSSVGVVSNLSKDGYYVILAVSPDNADGSSKISCTTGGANATIYPCFKLHAIAVSGKSQAKDAECKEFIITHTGKKMSRADGAAANTYNSPDNCW